MSDDIVQQLRDRRDEDGYCLVCGDGKWESHFPECVMNNAVDEIERLRTENERLRATVEVWQAQVERVKESFSESVFIPYTLSKAIAKRDITFENLTAAQWFEIYKWFYKDRYDEYPDEPQA